MSQVQQCNQSAILACSGSKCGSSCIVASDAATITDAAGACMHLMRCCTLLNAAQPSLGMMCTTQAQTGNDANCLTFLNMVPASVLQLCP
jgi:hypothetical protein